MIIFCCHRYLILRRVFMFANFTFYNINISFQVGKISCQVAEWVSDMFYNSYLVKNKIKMLITQQPQTLKKKHIFGNPPNF
jgi:hypothetical protein